MVSTPVQKAERAVALLVEARDLLRQAGSTKTVAKVNIALSSAKGAVRAAGYRMQREAEGRANG